MIGNGDDKNFLLGKAEEISREKTELLLFCISYIDNMR